MLEGMSALFLSWLAAWIYDTVKTYKWLSVCIFCLAASGLFQYLLEITLLKSIGLGLIILTFVVVDKKWR